MATYNVEELAKQAYEVYGKRAQWKNYQGKPMPQYDNLPPTIKGCWEVVASFFIGRLAK